LKLVVRVLIYTPVMRRIAAALLLCSNLATAADFKTAKVIEVRDASELGASVDTDVKADGKATSISPAIAYRCEVTVALEGVNYTAIYPSSRHLNPSELGFPFRRQYRSSYPGKTDSPELGWRGEVAPPSAATLSSLVRASQSLLR
jgi:hypothetical protein